MRITALLRKIHELAGQAENATAIDIDLMLDYTRVLYSDLLEWRATAPKPQLPKDAGLEQTPEKVRTPENAPLPPPEIPKAAPVVSAPTEQKQAPVKPEVIQQKIVMPEPVKTEAPKPEAVPQPFLETKAEPTLEEYMSSHAGRAIHRESVSVNGQAAASIDAAKTDTAMPVVSETPKPVAPAPPKPARDIRSMIGINDKYQIMSELFGNDKAAYEQALDVINRAESEQAAFNWLRERLWVTEDHSDAAMIFFDVVRRFKNL